MPSNHHKHRPIETWHSNSSCPPLKGFISLPVSQIQDNYYIALCAHILITKDYDYFKETGKQLQKRKKFYHIGITINIFLCVSYLSCGQTLEYAFVYS